MFEALSDIFRKPQAFENPGSVQLWNDPHISKQMLAFHLDPEGDPASRNKAFMDRSIAWLAQRFSIGAGTRILDLGCGPGLYTSAFARLGARVSGIDVSTNSIEYARPQAAAQGLQIDYLNANYVTCDFPAGCDLVTLIYDDYCVLTPDERRTLLKKVHAALEAGGAFVLDVLSLRYFDEVEEKQTCFYSETSGFWSPRAHFVFEGHYKYNDEHVLLEKDTVIEKERRFTIQNYLQCFSLDEIRQELSQAGFQTVEYYSDVAGTPYQEDCREIALVNIKK